jgi:hypothetical protein
MNPHQPTFRDHTTARADTRVQQLLDRIDALVATRTKARVCQTLAHLTTVQVDRAHLAARAAYWNHQALQQHAALVTALHAALPTLLFAEPATTPPTRPPGAQHVDLHATLDHGQRSIIVRYHRLHALATGTALIACATASTPSPPAPPSSPAPPLPHPSTRNTTRIPAEAGGTHHSCVPIGWHTTPSAARPDPHYGDLGEIIETGGQCPWAHGG